MYSEINGRKLTNSANKEIYLISDYKLQDLKNIVICDAIVLDYNDKEGCNKFLRNIRQSLIESIYLIPVFILSQFDEVDSVSVELSDGIISTINNPLIIEKTNLLAQRRDNLKITEATSTESRILNKLLRFYYSRNKELTPVLNSKSHIGYEYPLISGHYKVEESIDLLALLNNLVDQDLFLNQFVDKVKLCKNCSSSFLNYREVCPKCNSFNLVAEGLIHHLDCGYIGLEKAFGNPRQLICPNCEKGLWQFGVDYTKPTGTFSCNNCKHLFRESTKNVFCFNCRNITTPEMLINANIYSLKITENGTKMAIGEVKKEVEKTEPNVSGFVSFTTFTTFLEYEIQRTKTTNIPVSIGKIKIDISINDKNRLGHRFINLVEEIGEFIKNTSLSGDIITVGPNDVFLIISPFNSLTKLDFLLGNMQISIQKMLSMSFPEYDISVRVKSNFIDGRTQKTEMINDLIR